MDAAAPPTPRLFWLLHSAGWTGVFLISYLSAQALGERPSYWKISLPLALTGFLVTLGLRYVLRRLADEPPRRLIALMIGPVLLACGAMAMTYIFSLSGWCSEYRPSGTLGYVAYMATTIYIVMTWVGLYIGISYHQRLRQQTEAALAASAIAHQAQLMMLRYQLNPHFLFNTLNAISTLILDRDTTTANRMVQGLSGFLRHSLDNDPVQQVTLEQELAALDLYLGIEAVRFRERLRVERDIGDDCRAALLPSLLLQPLVENAIKHAVARRIEGGTLRLCARRDGRRLCLSVADDGPGIAGGGPAVGSGVGVGLRNTRERLRVLYGADQSFELCERPEGGCAVRISLPFETAPDRAQDPAACAGSGR
jgi:signal transduction histidine kinase